MSSIQYSKILIIYMLFLNQILQASSFEKDKSEEFQNNFGQTTSHLNSSIYDRKFFSNELDNSDGLGLMLKTCTLTGADCTTEKKFTVNKNKPVNFDINITGGFWIIESSPDDNIHIETKITDYDKSKIGRQFLTRIEIVQNHNHFDIIDNNRDKNNITRPINYLIELFYNVYLSIPNNSTANINIKAGRVFIYNLNSDLNLKAQNKSHVIIRNLSEKLSLLAYDNSDIYLNGLANNTSIKMFDDTNARLMNVFETPRLHVGMFGQYTFRHNLDVVGKQIMNTDKLAYKNLTPIATLDIALYNNSCCTSHECHTKLLKIHASDNANFNGVVDEDALIITAQDQAKISILRTHDDYISSILNIASCNNSTVKVNSSVADVFIKTFDESKVNIAQVQYHELYYSKN